MGEQKGNRRRERTNKTLWGKMRRPGQGKTNKGEGKGMVSDGKGENMGVIGGEKAILWC